MNKVLLSRAARARVHNSEALARRAEALAREIVLPRGLEFARFEHEGKTFALSARLLVEVDPLDHRVPDVVIRSREGAKPPR